MRPDAEHDFAQFYDATWSRTVACVYAMTSDIGVAEELSQDAYAKAWSRWSALSKYDNPGAWVRHVATRQAVSRWRRGRAARAWLAKQRVESTPGPDETSAALVAALQRLPEAQRRAIVLHHLADIPVDEVARLEQCPAGTVKARLARGRAALAVLLDDEPNGAPTHA